ncbi:hypothetical protein Tco_0853969, partial [Tanacetum coccineum]
MEFDSIPRSLPPIRRTSIDLFRHSTYAILNFIEDLVENGLDTPLVLPQQLRRLVSDARYAFDRIHQRIQARRYRVNLPQLWLYLGLPIHQVSANLRAGDIIKSLMKNDEIVVHAFEVRDGGDNA